jgi:hypothetical protein
MKTHAPRQTRPAQRQPATQRREEQRHTGAALHPREAAQRQRIDGAFGTPVQRAAEEEELLQGRFAPAQRMDEEELLQGRFEPAQRREEEELLQGRFTVQRVEEEEPLQGRMEPGAAPANRTGMPDTLKQGVESLSGMDLSDVRVHANSAQPAQLDALAYAQGNDIHLAPGQEKHLPHEAWHVVQQRQGRVQPTMQLAGVAVNDDVSLEAEADRMGERALQTGSR